MLLTPQNTNFKIPFYFGTNEERQSNRPGRQEVRMIGGRTVTMMFSGGLEETTLLCTLTKKQSDCRMTLVPFCPVTFRKSSKIGPSEEVVTSTYDRWVVTECLRFYREGLPKSSTRLRGLQTPLWGNQKDLQNGRMVGQKTGRGTTVCEHV